MQPIKVTYTDAQLRILIEEHIAMQRTAFTFSDVCSYILFRAMEEEKTTNTGLYESNQLDADDCNRVWNELDKITGEGRIEERISNNEKQYIKK